MRESTRSIKSQAERDHRRIYQQRVNLWRGRTATQNITAEGQRLDTYRARWERIRAEEAETPTAKIICDRMLEAIESRRGDMARLFGEVAR